MAESLNECGKSYANHYQYFCRQKIMVFISKSFFQLMNFINKPLNFEQWIVIDFRVLSHALESMLFFFFKKQQLIYICFCLVVGIINWKKPSINIVCLCIYIKFQLHLFGARKFGAHKIWRHYTHKFKLYSHLFGLENKCFTHDELIVNYEHRIKTQLNTVWCVSCQFSNFRGSLFRIWSETMASHVATTLQCMRRI